MNTEGLRLNNRLILAFRFLLVYAIPTPIIELKGGVGNGFLRGNPSERVS